MRAAVFCMALVLVSGAQPVFAKPLEKVDTPAVIELISSGKGKITIVNFWASWCPPCREEMPELKKVRDAYTQDQVLLLGISIDENAKSAEEAVTNFGLNYPAYLAEQDVYATFGIQSIPRLLIYDAESKLIVDHVGPVTYEDLKKFIDEEVLKEPKK